MTHSFPRSFARSLLVLFAAAVPAVAQTVLPLSPQEDALGRCERMVNHQPMVAQAAAREVLAASGTTPDQRVIATACLAAAQSFANQQQEGAASLDEAIKLLDAPGVTPMGRLMGRARLPSILLRVGRVDEALALQESLLADARERNIVPMQLEALRFLGMVRATEFDDPEGALAYYRQAYDLSRALLGVQGRRYPLPSYDLGYTLLVLGRFAEADAKFAEAAEIAAGQPEFVGMLDRIASHRAEILRQQGDAAGAEERLGAVLDRQRANHDLAGIAVTARRLASARLDQGRVQDAQGLAREALEVAQSNRFLHETRDALGVLADVSAAMGDTQKAADYAARAREIGRGLDRQATERRLASLQAQAANDLKPEAMASRSSDSQAALIRNVAVGVLGVLALTALVLARRARRRQHELAALGNTDALTGLPNRRGITSRIEALAGGGDARAALLLVDIDHFKKINDRQGHDVGDRALTAVAACLRQSCDAGDLVARWGGEEFLVLRENTSQDAAFALAAHLRAQVERLQVAAEDADAPPLQLSVSIGVASLPLFPQSGDGWQAALRTADRALYAAKRAGRNAWVGLWGVAAGVDVRRALNDVPAALAEGWFVAGGNRPVDWSPRSTTPPSEKGAARAGAGLPPK